MKVEKLIEFIGGDFYAGVPDSQLKCLCDYLMNTHGIDLKHHIIAANEGACTALAAGYYMANGKIPVVYMQNSGIGNIVNPVTSLLNERVYAIPIIYIIGWRGEPGVKDESQHVFQGEITLKLLEDIGIKSFVIGSKTEDEEVQAAMSEFRNMLAIGKSVAFVIQKDALSYNEVVKYENNNRLMREEIIQHITMITDGDPIIATTGKTSRELYEVRETHKQSHKNDFLTVGSMGYSSSIALGVAISKPQTKIWCIDGDGALLMHMGAMAVIGSEAPNNLVHIVINNGAHESVGGMPTVAAKMDLTLLAKACGYLSAVSVDNLEELDKALNKAKQDWKLSFIEVKAAIGSRPDLGRPTTTASENKKQFMNYLLGM